MTHYERFEELAALKSQIKDLTEAAKNLQAAILEDPDAPKRVKTDVGVLTLSTRTTYECQDKNDVIDRIGIAGYVAASTVTLPSIKKVEGSRASEDLLEAGVFTLKSESMYYTLRK